MEIPETRYATTSDGVSIAYQVVGDGPVDIVYVTSAYASNMEIAWEWSLTSTFFTWLAARGRLVMFDRRGAGLSDGVSGERLPTLEARMEDIRAVMDAAGSERAVLYGMEDGAAQCFLFAATYPERTRAIISTGAASRGLWSPESPWLWTEEQWDEDLEFIDRAWGTQEYADELTRQVFPSRVNDARFIQEYGRVMRHALRKADALAAERMWRDTDVRDILPLIQAPTLVMHVVEDRIESVQEARYIAEHIPGASLAELPGADHGPLGDHRPHRRLPRLAARRGAGVRSRARDRPVHRHRRLDRARGGRRRHGVEGVRRAASLDRAKHARAATTGTRWTLRGDGFFATFNGPARAIRCGRAIVDAVQTLGLEVRAGVHTGEVETIDDKIGGIAVNIGARVAAHAAGSEVLVSQTVKDLVAGSGLALRGRRGARAQGRPRPLAPVPRRGLTRLALPVGTLLAILLALTPREC